MEIVVLLFIFGILINIFLKPKKKKKQRPYVKRNTNNINSNQRNLYNTINKSIIKENTYMNPTDIAVYFNISATEMNKIFAELKWAKKVNRWWIATELGKERGAKEHYDYKRKVKFIKWNSKIKENLELITKIKEFKENIVQNNEKIQPKYTPKMTNKEKKEKGDKYEEYIANFFREQGYYVREHGKEKGVLDSSIDLFIKKDTFIYFVQCKNWENWKINHKEVKATRLDVREYLKKEKTLWKIIKNYQSKILYVTPKECLTKSAYTYIKENSDIVEYQVIPMEDRNIK